MSAPPEWEAVVGLEVHAHLKTRTKMFCRCELDYGAAENTHTCPVCLAHPGALPVPNGKAIEHTILLGLALDCEIAGRAVFARKNYFYPDLPKGYQISQYEAPLCGRGVFRLPHPCGDHEVGIVRAHLEEDAAKTVHAGGATGRSVGATTSLVDFNRGGTPLLEIVTEPHLRSAEEAMWFLRLLRQTIVELGVSDAEMEKGTLRADVNVCVRQHRGAGLPAALGDQEHELVHVHRPRDRGRRSASRSPRTRPARPSRPVDLRLRPRHRPADRAPLEGGGGRLPLLPGARPRPGRAARRARRAAAGARWPSVRPSGSGGSSPRSASSPPSSSSRPAATGSTTGSSPRARTRATAATSS